MDKNLPDKILDSAVEPNLVSSGMEITEIGLDQLLDESFLKQIPIVSTVFGIIKGTVSVRDKIFMAKVLKFLTSLPKMPQYNLENFRQKLASDLGFKQKVGTSLVLLLDRLNDLDKPKILSKLFAAFLLEKIDYDQFRRLGVAVELAFIDDLKRLCRSNNRRELYPNLIHTGLVWFEGGKTFDQAGEIIFELSHLGNLFIEIMTQDDDNTSGSEN